MGKRTGWTKTSYARNAILEHFADLEDLRLAENRIAALHAGKSGTVTLAKLMKRYGIGH